MTHPDPPSSTPPAPAPDSSSATIPRRGFLTKVVAGVIGGLVALFPLAIGLFAFFDPLRKRGDEKTDAEKEGEFVRVASLAALPATGVPRFFRVIVEDRVDAWTHFHDEPIGSVWVRRTGAAERETVQAYNATCPHAGCLVGYVPGEGAYLCPCHNSFFSIEGERSEDSPSPRGLDELACEIRDGDVWVKFQNFRTGTTERIPLA